METRLHDLERAYPNDYQIAWRLGDLYCEGHELDLPGTGSLADATLQRAIALRPDGGEGHLLFGVFLTDSTVPANWPEGEVHLRQAIELSGATPSPGAWSTLATNLHRQGRLAEARDAMDRYLALDPSNQAAQQYRTLLDQQLWQERGGQ